MNNQHQEAQRAEFEKWDQDRYEIDVSLYETVNGMYLDRPIQNRWETWQAASSPPAPTGSTECEWSEDDPFGSMPGTYASACGELWSFIDGGPKENNVRFCQGCGKTVRILPYTEQEPDHG